MASFYGADPTNSGSTAPGGNPTGTTPSWGGLPGASAIDPSTGAALLPSQYYAQNPNAAYYTWLNQQGLGGASSISQYAQGQQSRYYSQYLSQLPYMQAPSNGFLDYLNSSGVNPGQEYSNLGQRAQGLSPFMYSPRARFTVPT